MVGSFPSAEVLPYLEGAVADHPPRGDDPGGRVRRDREHRVRVALQRLQPAHGRVSDRPPIATTRDVEGGGAGASCPDHSGARSPPSRGERAEMAERVSGERAEMA